MGLVEDVVQRKRSTVALVVPSIREESLKRFIDEWSKTSLFGCVDLILVEDNPTKTFKPEYGLVWCAAHVAWDRIDEHEWAKSIIPRRSDTVRSFGYWLAWAAGYEYIMTLDDDCYPNTDGDKFFSDHVTALQPRTRWFNTLSGGRPRGLPYENLGEKRVAINHGLWENVLDMDAPTQLVAPFEDHHDRSSRVVTPGFYFPMCGMNLMWRAEYTVLMYHMLMGSMLHDTDVRAPHRPKLMHERVGTWGVATDDKTFKLPFDRFGDIWCGIVAKKFCDAYGLLVTSGMPYVNHSRASNPFTNLRKEANGIAVNEKFWELIDGFDVGAHENSIDEAYGRLGSYISSMSHFAGDEFQGYFNELGRAMGEWSRLFRSD